MWLMKMLLLSIRLQVAALRDSEFSEKILQTGKQYQYPEETWSL